MVVTRTFHPVGQGAFFTEVFHDFCNHEHFTVVYDCGSKSKPGIPLKLQIQDAFVKAQRPIDLFFISHFDDDHVNGVECLIDNGCLSEKTIIVFPFCEDYQIELYEIDKSRSVSNIFSLLRAHRFSKVFFIPLTTAPDSDTQNVDVRELSENLGKKVTIMGLEGTLITSNSVFTYKGIWKYVPFTMNDEASIDFFEEIKDSDKVTIQDIQDVYNNVLKNGMKNNEKLKELKRIYNEVGHCRKKDRHININSLAVLSQSIIPVDCILGKKTSCCMNHFGFCQHYLDSRSFEYASCVYTGDLNLKEDSDFESFEERVGRYTSGGIDLIQIPHHGSSTSYNNRLTHGNSLACFTNFDSNKKIFNKDILFDFALAHKPLFLVTESYDSKFIQKIKIT